MQKEIFEQPEALTRTIQAYLHDEQIDLKLPFSDDLWRGIDRVSVVACGTSWHAGLVAKFLIEQIARVPVDVDYASEFRYRDPIVTRKTLALAITQSGETADTVAALKQAAARGARTLVVCNSIGSQATRLAEGTLLTHAGLEMGVASTKAFSTQLAVLTLLAIHLGRARGVASHASGAERSTRCQHRSNKFTVWKTRSRRSRWSGTRRRARSIWAAARCTRWRSRALSS
jgi:glucosamine--fructose-6-phosphate aminotransferase (isomerizing)